MATKKKTTKGNGNGKTLTLKFELEKETKNTNRYKEVREDEDQRAYVGTIYLLKSVAEGADELEVSITPK